MTLYNFSDFFNSYRPQRRYHNAPEDALVLAGNTLYGTSSDGGDSGGGTIFAVTIESFGFA